MVGAELLEGLSEVGLELRYVGVAIVFAVLIYWTLERVWGESDDPVLRLSASSETGSLSFLSSGLATVGLVALVGLMLIYPEVAQGHAQTIALALVALVGAHWFIEKEERE